MNREGKSFEIKELVAIASRAGQCHLSPVSRRRILAQVASQRGERPGLFRPYAPRSILGQMAAAAALLVLLILPAALITTSTGGSGSASRRDDLNLQVRLQQDGSVVLEWENGKSVHTVRRATSTADLARVSGLRVEGGRFIDSAAPSAQVVYYQVD